MAYDAMKFQAGTLEREIYDTLFPRFQNLIGPGLFKEIIQAVVRESGFGDHEAMRAEIDRSNEEVSSLRQDLDHLSDCLNGLAKSLTDTMKTVESLRKYAKEKSEG